MSRFFILAGPNGAGKTTLSKQILATYGCQNFINADEIARVMNPLYPDRVKIQAGKEMLTKIEDLSRTKKSFCVETTLSTKTYIAKLKYLKSQGYTNYLFFIHLSKEDLAIQRVKDRHLKGGHTIPVDWIKRRYYRGLKNLVQIYWDATDYLFIYNNDNFLKQVYQKNEQTNIFDPEIYHKIKNYA